MKKVKKKTNRSKKELAQKLQQFPIVPILQLEQLDTVVGGFDLEDY